MSISGDLRKETGPIMELLPVHPISHAGVKSLLKGARSQLEEERTPELKTQYDSTHKLRGKSSGGPDKRSCKCTVTYKGVGPRSGLRPSYLAAACRASLQSGSPASGVCRRSRWTISSLSDNSVKKQPIINSVLKKRHRRNQHLNC